MGWGTGNLGGGSGGLNFKVVGGLTQPAGLKENTIWVNTDQKITSWIFSAEQPAEPEEGMAWFKVGASKKVSFNALKKNAVMVYPVSGKMYINASWGTVSVKIYQNGEWADWWSGGYLYNAGDEFADITGGWVATAATRGSEGTGVEPTIIRGSNAMTITAAATKGGVVHTKNKIVLDGLTNLTFTGTLDPASNSGYWTSIGVWTEIGDNYKENLAAVFDTTSKKTGTQTIDVSELNGEYYIGLAIYGSSEIVMESMNLE